MSNATCTNCGKQYNWRASRGTRLADIPSPCCRAPGKAVGEHKPPPKMVCPRCAKAGLRRRDDQGRWAYDAGMLSEKGNWRWCPPCHEWIVPVTPEKFDEMHGLTKAN